MATLEDMRIKLQSLMPQFRGEWVGKAGYEKPFAQLIDAVSKPGRYWDCVWEDLHLELKMGNIWLDLVRYSEYLLKSTPESATSVITLFMKYVDRKVTDIYAVETPVLVAFLNLTEPLARSILQVKDAVPRSLNCQAGLAKSDLMKIAQFHVRTRYAVHVAAEKRLPGTVELR